MLKKHDRRLRVGILGCGPIAQFAHFESAAKACNAELHAICDVAQDLVQRMGDTWLPARRFHDYDAMLADPELEAVIIATADSFHVPAALRALAAGKHVLCEKPVGVSVEEAGALAQAVAASGKLLQVGHMKRFDPGLQAGQAFAQGAMGAQLAFKAWYCDFLHHTSLRKNGATPTILTYHFPCMLHFCVRVQKRRQMFVRNSRLLDKKQINSLFIDHF